MNDHVVVGLFEIAREHLWTRVSRCDLCRRVPPTVSASVKIYYRPDADVDDTQEALVLLLELLLVKYLNRQDAFFVHSPIPCVSVERKRRRVWLWWRACNVHVEALVPIGVQRLLDDARGARLLAIDGGYGEGVGKSCGACVSDATKAK